MGIPCKWLSLSRFYLPHGAYSFISALRTCDSPLVMKVRSRAGSVHSGVSTPGGGAFKSLSEGDLQKADAALSQVDADVPTGV